MMTSDEDHQPDGDNPDDGDTNEAATRIIGMPAADEGATRILPLAKPPGRSAERGQGNVIGISGNRPAAAGESDRTVVIPPGNKQAATISSPPVARNPSATTQSQQGCEDGAIDSTFDPAVAWLVILEGPGRGQRVDVFYGQNPIGRGPDQRIRLNFGDNRIAREAHAFIVYDDVDRKFYLRDNGKANLVRHNNKPVMTPTELADRDQISIGQTVMMFVAFCGPDFDWLSKDDGPDTASPA